MGDSYEGKPLMRHGWIAEAKALGIVNSGWPWSGSRTWTCPACQNTGWLCEQHPAEPMDHAGCSGAGLPCECNNVTAPGATSQATPS